MGSHDGHMTHLSIVFVLFEDPLQQFSLLLLWDDGFSDLPLGPVGLDVAKTSHPVPLVLRRLQHTHTHTRRGMGRVTLMWQSRDCCIWVTIYTWVMWLSRDYTYVTHSHIVALLWFSIIIMQVLSYYGVKMKQKVNKWNTVVKTSCLGRAKCLRTSASRLKVCSCCVFSWNAARVNPQLRWCFFGTAWNTASVMSLTWIGYRALIKATLSLLLLSV